MEPEKLEIVRLSNTYRRRKPETKVEVLEGFIQQRGQKYLVVALPIAVHDRSDLLNKRVEVRVIEP